MNPTELTPAELIITPAEIIKRLDEKVIGQGHAKKRIANMLWQNGKRAQWIASGVSPATLPPKQNLLFLGRSGCGKTYLTMSAAEITKRPFFYADATDYTAAGYIGKKVEDMIGGLLQVAEWDVKRAESGILFVDEVDKIKTRNMGSQDDVGGKAVQQMLLTFLEGNKAVSVKKGDRIFSVSTACISIIAAGAFEGLPFPTDGAEQIEVEQLVRFGMLRELCGRFVARILLKPLTEKDYRQLLVESETSPIKQNQNMFGLEGVRLVFKESAIDAIAHKAFKVGTGARALVDITTEGLASLVSELACLSGQGVESVIVDGGTITEGRPAQKIRRRHPHSLPASHSSTNPAITEKQEPKKPASGVPARSEPGQGKPPRTTEGGDTTGRQAPPGDSGQGSPNQGEGPPPEQSLSKGSENSGRQRMEGLCREWREGGSKRIIRWEWVMLGACGLLLGAIFFLAHDQRDGLAKSENAVAIGDPAGELKSEAPLAKVENSEQLDETEPVFMRMKGITSAQLWGAAPGSKEEQQIEGALKRCRSELSGLRDKSRGR